MNIGDMVIITPDESPIGYHLDWRHKLATVLSSDNAAIRDITESRIPLDKYIKEHKLFLNHISQPPSKNGRSPRVPRNFRDNNTVFTWYTAANTGTIFKNYIEAFLMTALPYNVIAEYLSITPQLVELYEKLFYNIRDEKGKDKESTILKLSLIGEAPSGGDTTAYVWKQTAATRGLNYLLALLNCNQEGDTRAVAQDIISASQTRFVQHLAHGMVKNYDLIEMIKASNDLERVYIDKARDDKSKEQDSVVSVRALIAGILGTMAPTMVERTVSDEDMKVTSEALRSKLLAAQSVDAVELKDNKDAAHAAFTATIRERIQ